MLMILRYTVWHSTSMEDAARTGSIRGDGYHSQVTAPWVQRSLRPNDNYTSACPITGLLYIMDQVLLHMVPYQLSV